MIDNLKKTKKMLTDQTNILHIASGSNKCKQKKTNIKEIKYMTESCSDNILFQVQLSSKIPFSNCGARVRVFHNIVNALLPYFTGLNAELPTVFSKGFSMALLVI